MKNKVVIPSIGGLAVVEIREEETKVEKILTPREKHLLESVLMKIKEKRLQNLSDDSLVKCFGECIAAKTLYEYARYFRDNGYLTSLHLKPDGVVVAQPNE